MAVNMAVLAAAMLTEVAAAMWIMRKPMTKSSIKTTAGGAGGGKRIAIGGRGREGDDASEGMDQGENDNMMVPPLPLEHVRMAIFTRASLSTGPPTHRPRVLLARFDSCKRGDGSWALTK